MKCPYCNKDMKSGYVQAGQQVFFTEKKHTWSFWLNESDTSLSRNNMLMPTCTAYHCPDCKKVIIDYEAING